MTTQPPVQTQGNPQNQRDILGQISYANDALNKTRGIFGTITSFVGSLVAAIPLVIIFGGVLAIAPRIIDKLPESWQDSAHGFAGMAKQFINDLLPGDGLFTVTEDERRAMLTGERVQSALQEAGVPQPLAEAIVPDTQAAHEFDKMLVDRLGFEDGVLTENIETLILEEANLERLMAVSPEMMLRVVRNLGTDASGASQSLRNGLDALDNRVKTPLVNILSDQARLTAMINANSNHEKWVNALIEQARTNHNTNFINDLNTRKEKLLVISGLARGEALDVIIDNNPDVFDAQDKQNLQNMTWQEMINHEKFGELFSQMHAADATFKEEALALSIEQLNGADKSELVALMLKNEARIDVLAELNNAQLNEMLSALNLDQDMAAMLQHQPSREAVIELLRELHATNTAGNNELADLIAQAMQEGNQFNTAGAIATYIEGNEAREAALANFADRLEAIANATGTPSVATHQAVAENIRELVGNAATLAVVHEAQQEASQGLAQEVMAMAVANPDNLLRHILTNDVFRQNLSVADSADNNRASIMVLGDQLAQMHDALKAKPANEQDPKVMRALALLSTKQGADYVNLNALVRAAHMMDDKTGIANNLALNLATREAAGETLSEAEQALINHENQSDGLNVSMMAVLLAVMDKDNVKRANPSAGFNSKTQYLVDTLVGEVSVTADGLAKYFKEPATYYNENGTKVSASRQSVTAVAQLLGELDASAVDQETQNLLAVLEENFWQNENGDNSVDSDEGIANYLYNANSLSIFLESQATGESQVGALAGIANGVAGFFGHTNSERLEEIGDALAQLNVGGVVDVEPSDVCNAGNSRARAALENAGRCPTG